MNLKRPTERIRVSDNFYLDEFIDPYTYFTEADNGLSKIDRRLFEIAQLLRDLDGKPKTINNWWSYYKGKMNTTEIRQIIFNIEHSQAHRKWSGLRTVRCSVGAKNGAHYSGQAFDAVGNGKELYNLVKKNAKEFHRLGVRRMEDFRITLSWIHLDTLERNTEPNSIRVVDLTKATEIIRW